MLSRYIYVLVCCVCNNVVSCCVGGFMRRNEAMFVWLSNTECTCGHHKQCPSTLRRDWGSLLIKHAHSETLMKGKSPAELGIAAMACHVTTLSRCFQMSCTPLTFVRDHIYHRHNDDHLLCFSLIINLLIIDRLTATDHHPCKTDVTFRT
jgi:hypothetical protein